MNLFDTGLANDDLLGGDPRRLLNLENAFYRAADKFQFTMPSRILWYVSKGKGRNIPSGISAVRACSTLVSVETDQANVIHAKYCRLGVYRRKNVLEIAGGNPNSPVMAFTFRQTELFNQPIFSDTLASFGVRPPFPGPREVSSDAFRAIYEHGTGSQNTPSEK